MTIETITLGARRFDLEPMPFGQLKKLSVAINRVGRALAAGVADDDTMEDLGQVLSIGLNMPLDELDKLPTNWHEACNAFRALMRVSGMEQEMEYSAGEAARRGPANGAPAVTHGTGSTPASSPSPTGDGTRSTA